MLNFCKEGKLTSWAQGMGSGLKNKQGLNEHARREWGNAARAKTNIAFPLYVELYLLL
jgi:hypothetical protein